MPDVAPCALCGAETEASALAEAGWIGPDAFASLAAAHPAWRRGDGGCPACVQHALLTTLLRRGEGSFRAGLQASWPFDAEAAFGAIPTPLRLHADPRFTGRGVTIALLDSGFFPHPDLTGARNRIRARVDARGETLHVERFQPDEVPRWPGWDARAPIQWHGLMTSVAAAGDGHLSHGLYRGLAPEAELVLIQVADDDGRIGNVPVTRALRWLAESARELGVRVVNLSLGGDPVSPLRGNPVDEAVAVLVAAGVTVVVAAGNDGRRRLVPPATAPEALTVGGLDDHNSFADDERALWHSSYGETALGGLKPELVAPSLWVVGPVLPGTDVAAEARRLFDGRAAGDDGVERRLAELRLVTPHYQHVEGTSFAAPIVSGIAACMLEANPALSPRRVRELLVAAARPVAGASPERQGAGAVDAGRAVSLALADRHSRAADFAASPEQDGSALRFLLHDHEARDVRLLGSWDGWAEPGRAARLLEDGLWELRLERPPAGRYAYKYLLDGGRWLADPANPARIPDGFGGFNSLVELAVAGGSAPRPE